MDNQLFRDIQTDLDLNGPILSFTTQPVDTTINVGQTATFTAVAAVSFPGDPTPINSGTIGYQWYGPNGILTEGTKYVGTKTTTLQIMNVTSPADVGAYYVVLDYVPSSNTGNALNEPLKSNNGNLNAPPLLEIDVQPAPITTRAQRDRNFEIGASLSDSGTDIGYQWMLDGEDISDGTIQQNTLTPVVGTQDVIVAGGVNPGTTRTFNIPKGSKRPYITIGGGVGGNGGGDYVVPNNPSLKNIGGRGGNGMEGIFLLGGKYFQWQTGNGTWGYIPNMNQVADGSHATTCDVTIVISTGRGGGDGVVNAHGSAGGTTPGSSGDGGSGGQAGTSAGSSASGNAGGGGGGGGASWITIHSDRFPSVTAAVAAGGGGGGGAWNQTRLIGSQQLVGSGKQGGDAGPARGPGHPHRGTFDPPVVDWVTVSGNSSLGVSPGKGGIGGHTGTNNDTPGGGGGGGGVNGGDSGWHGHQPGGANGGGAGTSGYNTEHLWRISGAYNRRYSNQSSVNGYGRIQYTTGQQQVTTIQNVTRTTTISGSLTPKLTLNTDGPGIGYTVTCSVSSPRASNSPLQSLEVDYNVLSDVDDADIVVEGIGVEQSTASTSQVNLANGQLTLDTIGTGFAGPVPHIQLYSLYAHNHDVNVEMDLYGGGASDGSAGEGGFARIRFTMVKDEEYVIAGLTETINTPFLYRMGTLIACVGEAAKTVVVTEPTFNSKVFKGRGGDGGGIGIAGGDGIHGHLNYSANGTPGKGGPAVRTGELSLQGIFGSAWGNWSTPLLYPGDIAHQGSLYKGHTIIGHNGGRTLRCTKGVYWAQQGVAPCSIVGLNPATGNKENTRFRLADGTEVTNSSAILRGYKAGYNIIQTAGGDYGHGTKGGNGATGGSGGLNDPGGGGSGYTDGSVTIVHTTQGGSTSGAKVVIRKLDDSLISTLP